ncbi:ABC transporter permease [Protofrankia symbiont of Coriaria ruscifolia]|uniref:ABC transporter permease n=1 Tax=Protofrankia symbiont of Coriaria ruscifolia TaxID=1306542 RepID=UPI0010417B4F|nr:ABC transporter permease [Protofrankia symbiont of Coriaria ruscifolia]
MTADLTLPRPASPRLRTPPAGVLLSALVVLAALLAVLAPQLLTSAEPNAVDPLNALHAPAASHPFGTDEVGRDIYTRVVHGARPALIVGVGATVLSVLAGIALGVLSAVGGRVIGEVVLRVVDILLAFPSLLLALLVIAVLGPGERNALVAIAGAFVPLYVRLVRVQVLAVLRSGYVEAAVAMGQRRGRVIARHVLPNALGPLLALATIGVGTSIIAGSSLSFLGLGPRQPTAEWGAMLAAGRSYFEVAWWMSIFPGAAVTLTVIAVTVLGRAVQARFDGRTA